MSGKGMMEELLAALIEGPSGAAAQALGIEQSLSLILNFLAEDFPHQGTNSLMHHVKHLLVSGTVQVVAYNVSNPHFAVFRDGDGGLQGAILLPLNWSQMVELDLRMAMGAMIFCGSQALDFHSDKIIGQSTESVLRAQANEAEFLRATLQIWPTSPFNEYQEGILQKFPEGRSSEIVAGLWYVPKPVSESIPPSSVFWAGSLDVD